MNKNGKLINGRVIGGIEWLKTVEADGTERPGFTWNPAAGCRHGCKWQMPDGKVAGCYAESVANRVAGVSYPAGFDHHYWHPGRLPEPLQVKQPSRIFLDSMADLMGSWVPESQIDDVLGICWQASWHTFLLLTKNAPRLLKFSFPPNLHPGVSSPPDWMFEKRLTRRQQEAMLEKSLCVLETLAGQGLITWMSFEPLSWDVSEFVARHPNALRWAVIGAASNGPTYYQPESEHVRRLLEVLDRQNIPVFFKGNLDWEPRRDEFPK